MGVRRSRNMQGRDHSRLPKRTRRVWYGYQVLEPKIWAFALCCSWDCAGKFTVDSPNNVLLSSAVGSAQLWDLASGSVRCTVVFGDVVSRELIAPASFTFADQIDISPSAKLFAIMRVDGRTTVYDERDCSVLDQFDPPVPPGLVASITAIALNQGGELAAALLDDSLIGIQNVRTKQAFPSQQVFPTRTVPSQKELMNWRGRVQAHA